MKRCAMLLACLGTSLAACGGEGKDILTEASVWRSHLTWGPFMQDGAGGAKPVKVWNQLKFSTASPAGDWAKPEFDDGGWILWRETHAAQTFQGTATPLYDSRQYGVQQTPFVRRICLRGRFEVAEAAGVRGLKLTVVYRGGAVAFLNGQEIGRDHLSKEAGADPMGLAEIYPPEVYTDTDGKPWGLVNGGVENFKFKDAAATERFNLRMRKLSVDIPSSALRKGANVLALDLRAAPSREDAGSQDWWSPCGVATIALQGDGAVTPAVERPAGVQAWAASSLFKASPFGIITTGRVGKGTMVYLYNFPVCYTGAGEGAGSIRMVGTRNGVFTGQVVVSSGSAIRGLKAEAGELVQKGGGGKIPTADCQVGYMTFPSEPPTFLSDVPVSLLDILHDKPVAEVPALAATPAKSSYGMARREGVSWCAGGATAAVWLRVRVPKDAAEGEYAGTLTVSADGLKPTAVPVSLKVHGYVLPDPGDFSPHVGLVHSPDSLALQYKAPLWSDQHFALMEKTVARMGELGGSVVFIPLMTGTWLGPGQGMVGAGGDFKVFDRYLDMVQKHMKPRAVVLYVYHPANKGQAGDAGSWKPIVDGALSRLKQRGLDKRVTLGMTFEGGGRGDGGIQQAVDLFKSVWPEGKWTDLAHYGAKKGEVCGVPYGYTMSVWGNQTPFKSKKWGMPDLPLVVVKHFRADPVIDMRPIASRGSLYWATEQAMSECQGIGPLGMDFWNFPAGAAGGRRSGSLESGATNLDMSTFSAAALLAPGPEGPLPTARFEMFRQGLQVCEARTLLERAKENGKLSGDLAKRCDEVLTRRKDVYSLLWAAGRYAQGEGWSWFENAACDDLTGELFAIAGEVAKASGK